MRKRIAVFTGGWSGEFIQEVLAGIIQILNEANMDVFTFMNFSVQADVPQLNDPEVNIFKLPDLKEFDGVILLGNSFNRAEEIDYLVPTVKKVGIPCVSVEYKFDDIPYISTDNYSGMFDLVTHMIADHHLTKLLYISGPKSHPEAMERLQAFTDATKNQEVLIPDSSIQFADWSKSMVPDIINGWKEENGEYPEAVICANDMMALAAAAYLKDLGLKIPDDIKVTGYDCIRLAQIQNPPITSVNHEWNNMGKLAAGNLVKLINGEEIPKRDALKTKFVRGGSCGCHMHHNLVAYNELGRALTSNTMDPIDMDSHFRHFYSAVRKPNTKQDLYYSLSHLFQTDHTIEGESFKLCIDPGFFIINNGESDLLSKGFRDYYDVITSLEKGVRQPYRQISRYACIFESSQMAEEPGYYVFFPISSEGKSYGFAMLSGALNVANESQFYIWTRHMNTALEQVRSNFLLQDLWDELMKQSVTDALTGAFNRHGCEMNTYPKMIDWTGKGGTSAIMLIDVDHMKTINDQYGHANGDRALEIVTSVMRMVLPSEFSVSRFGGDEFFIGGLLKDPDIDMDNLVNRMETALAQEVANRKIVFPLTMSIGYSKIQPKNVSDIEKAIVQADKGMYLQKEKHHSADKL